MIVMILSFISVIPVAQAQQCLKFFESEEHDMTLAEAKQAVIDLDDYRDLSGVYDNTSENRWFQNKLQFAERCVDFYENPSFFENMYKYTCSNQGDTCSSIGCTESEANEKQEKMQDHLKYLKNDLGKKYSSISIDSGIQKLETSINQLDRCIDYFGTRDQHESLARDLGNQFGVTEEDVIELVGGEEKVKEIYDKECLIATASFGSPMAKEVQMLREIRDTQLLQTNSGSIFMSGFNTLYYSFAPTIAQWEQDNPAFKQVVKLSITPLITSLSLLNYVSMDSEGEVLGYGISMIALNLGMYFVAPAIVIWQIKKRI